MTPQDFKTERKRLLDEMQKCRNQQRDLRYELSQLEESVFCSKDSSCQYNDFTHGCPKCHPATFSTDKAIIKQIYESNWGSDWVDDGV